jgi:hypothetical protein
MAFKAINLHCLIFMACYAKTVVARDHAVILGAGMTFNAVFQTDLIVANTFAYSLITLMFKQMHVILEHPLRISHALPTFADIRLGRECIVSPSYREKTAKQQSCKKLHYSPKPI